jgi:hypothetical protein
MSLIVICPSRGRPGKAREAFDSFEETRRSPYSRMLFVVDQDDPTRHEYNQLVPVATYEHEGGGMGPPLNAAALDLAGGYDVLGFIGDDHRFRTEGWDLTIETALEERGGGFAYGNDLARSDIPTQVFISSRIVRKLGWMALPGAKHLYLDNTWAQLGHRSKSLIYLPSVVIEHLHPFYGKGAMDAGYQRVNAPSMYEHDRVVFEHWVVGHMDTDIALVREALG